MINLNIVFTHRAGGLKPVRLALGPDRWRHLAATRALLQNGKPLRLLVLGDSIANDMSNSQFHLPIQRRFPKANITLLAIGLAAMLPLFAPRARGTEVTVALVTGAAGQAAPLGELQSLWSSPFGGWVVMAWPFGMRVDDTPILEYHTSAQKLMAETMGSGAKSSGGHVDDLLEETFGLSDAVRPEDLATFRLDRPASARISLNKGRHVVEPFGITFMVARDGTLTTQDPRLRIDAKNSRVRVVCHPVKITTVAGNRSVPSPLQITYASRSLLGGLGNLITEFNSKNKSAGGPASAVFRSVTLYLPASAPGKAYEVNGIPFDLDAEGRVNLAAGTKARSPGGREIQLLLPAAEPAATQPLGVRWFGAATGISISCGSESVSGDAETGSAWLPIPAGGDRTLTLDRLKVTLPSADPRWPHGLLVWDVAKAACWALETASLAAKPGAEWSCRITPVSGNALALPATLAMRLEPIGEGTSGGKLKLVSRGEGIYSGALPSAPGLWQLIAGNGYPLKGQPLGLAYIGADVPKASVSMNTYRNRGIFRRGDAVDLFWIVRAEAGTMPTELPVVLRGLGLETQIGKAAGSKITSGCMRLDTTSLAPGVYEVNVRAEGVAGYPARFRICQREPQSDFEVYSFVFGQAKPYGGSPVTAYYGNLPGGPGLDPFLMETDASLDPALATYAAAVAGPAIEKFNRPPPDEAKLMALAGMGMRAVLSYPPMLHHEDWNPKHTLPDDLAQMRRRLALFVQPKADFPGLSGISLGWYATLGGYWEESPQRDGHQARRNAEAGARVAAQVAAEVEKARAAGLAGEQLDLFKRHAAIRFRSAILPNAFQQYLADAVQIVPGLTAHNAIPTWWLGRGAGYSAYAYDTLTTRDAVDYSDYGLTAWGNFRTPAWMNMGNRKGQKLHVNFAANQFNRIVTAFGATGRGLDGISMPSDGEYPQSEDEALLRIFERFGSYFSALEPLPDVALYNTDTNPQNVAMHDLARMRRPAMLLGPEDVLAGELDKYRVLFLVHAGEGEPAEVLQAFRTFEAKGGVVLKDRTCHASLPGRDIGFGYDGAQVHPVWGLAYANGEDEFAHLLKNFKKTREKFLVEAFAKIPGIPVTTPDSDVVISPLAGKESICCFVINQTLVPTRIPGKWRQYFVLPKVGELQIEDGWHVRDLLAGTAASVERTPQGQRTAVDLTRAEGAIYLLTKREPKAMAMQAVRTAANALRLTAWLADAKDQPLPDPMPFEVTLKGPGGVVFFHKFTALATDCPLEVAVPALAQGTEIDLVVRDLVIGCTATQRLAPAAPGTVATRAGGDFVGGVEPVSAFLTQRKGPVTVLLDEGQDGFRLAAEQLAALLKKAGREARVVGWNVDEIQPLPLRWKPTEEDRRILESLRDGRGFASRVALRAVASKDGKSILFDDPDCGYDEYGPRLRHDADIVLFGTPETHRVLAELKPYLRRIPSENYPPAGGFFIHYLWAPLQGGYDGLYVGCRDAAGASAAVASLAAITPAAPSAPAPQTDAKAVVTRGGSPAPLENLVIGKFGVPILNVAFAPNSKRLFVTTDSLSDSLFVIGPTGEIQDKRDLHHRRGNYFAKQDAALEALDDRTVKVGVGGVLYRYNLDKGWVGKTAIPPTGFSGRFSVPVAASTFWEDAARGRTYLGGARRIRALDAQGRLLWSYDDGVVRTSTDDLLYPRCLFPRGVTADGRVLLVAGFGIQYDCYSMGKAVNTSILGLDTASGKFLWALDGTLLNTGKAIGLENRFLVVDDSGTTRVIRADTGQDTSNLRSVGAADWVLALPGRDELLIVENNGFDRQGPTARVYVRPLDAGPDRELPTVGRVTDVAIAPDGQSVTLVTVRGATLRFAPDGRLLWQAATPAGGIVRQSPDGQTVLVGASDGVLHWLNAADGKRVRSVDFNPFNVTTAERFVKQLDSVGEVPDDTALTVPPKLPEPSYRASLDSKRVAFGPNLISEDHLRAALSPASPAAGDPAKPAQTGKLAENASFTFQVEAGKTYLIELLASAADPAKLTPQTRLEVAVTGARKTANLPYIVRLPLSRFLTRRRAAFRADEDGEVNLTLRAVQPAAAGQGNTTRLTYHPAEASPAGLLVGDVLVAGLLFPGRNVLFDGGPAARSNPSGDLTCEVKPWTGGSSLVRSAPYPCAQASIRCVDGILANQETAWTLEAKGGDVACAEGRIHFRRPQSLAAIAVYEDTAGPVIDGAGVRETVAMRYGVYVREAKTKRWLRVGLADSNTDLVNIFECPPVLVDEILYFWAGRNDAGRTDGVVRMTELEAYSADDLDFDFDFDNTSGDDTESLLNID